MIPDREHGFEDVVETATAPWRLVDDARWLFRAIVGGLVFAHGVFVFAAITGDAGVFMTIGDGLLQGKLPYVEYFDHKPPGIYVLLAVTFGLVRSALAAKVVVLIANLATATVVGWIGRRYLGVPYGLAAAGLFLAGSLAYSGPRVYTEQFVALCGVLATVAFLRALSRETPRTYVLVGVLTGVAILFKQTGLALLGAFLVGRVLWGPGHRRRLVADGGAIVAGAAVPLGLAVGLFALQGALEPMVQLTLLIHAPGGPYTPDSLVVIAGNLREITAFPLLWVLATTGFAMALSPHVDRPIRLVALVGAFSATPLLIRGWGHYYLQPLPFAAILAVFGVHECRESLTPLASRPGMRVLVTAVFVVLTLPLAQTVFVTAAEDVAGHNALDDQRLGSELQSATVADENVLALGEQAKFYFLADRSPPTRYLYYLPINRHVADQDALRALIDERTIPAIVVASSCQRTVQPTCEHVRETYTPDRSVGDLTVYTPQ